MTLVTADDCVFMIKKGKSVLIVAIVVNDVLMVGNDESLRQQWFTFMQGWRPNHDTDSLPGSSAGALRNDKLQTS
eukprot:1713482-Rhodomonas_salina.1